MAALKFLLALIVCLAAILCGLIYLPSDFEPELHKELPLPPQPFEGPFGVNEELRKAEILSKAFNGPEEFAFDKQGRLYTGTADGKIVRFDEGNKPPWSFKVIAKISQFGRPLGMEFNSTGSLIVADADLGLISVDVDNGRTTVLANEADGVPIVFCDHLDIASDGTVYFSDVSYKWGLHELDKAILDGTPTGRLLKYDPKEDKVTVLLKDLYFANGVALSQKEDFVLIAETTMARIKRFWLKGPNKGKSDIFIAGLPGFPDNLSSNGKGTFWVALVNPRTPFIEQLMYQSYATKKVLAFVGFPQSKYGLVASFNENGNFTKSLHDATGEIIYSVTSAREHSGYLYLGTFSHNCLARYKL